MAAHPKRLGPYQILGPLGQGGMGVVYRALHLETGTIAAVKTVAVPMGLAVQSIRREIRALARIHHPGIVRILDEGVAEGLPWYAMELVEGKSLRQHCAELAAADAAAEPEALLADTAGSWMELLPHSSETQHLSGVLSPAQATAVLAPREPVLRSQVSHRPQAAAGVLPAVLRLVRKLCAPLGFLHGEGIVHRDLKPQNVLVRESRTGHEPVLVDFGLVSRVRDALGREALEIETSAVGTAAYMAPEQIRGELVDARADLYALGCLLFELLTGRPPFKGSNLKQLLTQHLCAPPPKPSTLVDGVPPELDALVLGLLAKERRERIGHAADVASVLGQILGEPEIPDAGQQPRAYLYRPGFSGRQAEIERLRSCVQGPASGAGGLVLAGGPSGSGKTRLLVELARGLAGPDVQVFTGCCLPTAERNTALAPLRPALEAVADRCRQHGLLETERLLRGDGRLLAAYEPALLGLPGQDDLGAHDVAPLPLDAARLRLFRALAQTFCALAGSGGVLLVLDDLQWADELTLGFLEHLAQAAAGAQRSMPLQVAGSYRTEELNEGLERLLALPGVARIELGPLRPEAVAAMVGDMLALPAPPPVFSSYLSRQSEGNPLFVAEYLRTAVEEGLLWRDGAGRWQVADAAAYEDLPLPGSLRELVGRRLDALGASAWAVLEAAAVLGREAELEVLSQVLGQASAECLLDGLDELDRRLVLEAPAPHLLRFAHDKMREVAYARLPEERRLKLHRAAAEAIEKIFGAEPAGRQAALGHHWEQAGDRARACPHYLAAARGARSSYAHAEAERLYGAYLRLVPRPSLASVEARNELGFDVLRPQGKIRQAEEELHTAVAQARSLGDSASEGQGLRHLGFVLRETGRLEEARELFELGLPLARQAGDRRNEGRLLGNLGDVQHLQGRPEVARITLERSLEILRAAGDREFEGRVLGNLAILHRDHGRMEAAFTVMKQALVLAREEGYRPSEGIFLGNLAGFHHRQGRFQEALALYEQALAIKREVGDRRGEGLTLDNIAVLLREQGRLPEARSLYEQALGIKREVGDRLGEALSLGNLADLDHVQGRLEAAEALYEKVLDVFRTMGYRRFEGSTLGSIGLLHHDRGRLDEARALYGQAFAIACEAGDRRLQGHWSLHQGRLERHSGRNADAAQKLATAEQILRTVGDRYCLAIVLAERGHLALAEGGAGRFWLEAGREVAAGLSIAAESELGQALGKLERAVAAAQAGAPLLQGELPEDLPAGLCRVLEAASVRAPLAQAG